MVQELMALHRGARMVAAAAGTSRPCTVHRERCSSRFVGKRAVVRVTVVANGTEAVILSGGAKEVW